MGDEGQGGTVRDEVRLGLSRSLASLVIKLGTAGLTYAMFVVLSRSMEGVEYGLFAFGFSLATMLSIGASMGQQTAILRFWPEEQGRGRPEAALLALRSGWALTLGAGTAISLALAGGATVWMLLDPDTGAVLHLIAAAALVLPMGAAEYASSALRAQGSVWTALLPRDILWRLAVPLVVVGLAGAGVALGGAAALLIAAGLLVAALLAQVLVAGWRGYRVGVGFAGIADYWRERGRASRWFLFGTVIDSAALNVDIVLVGLFIAAESAGVYFNAFRTAGLMTLFMYAITLVIAPQVARHYHAGDLRKAQAVTTLCAWAGFGFAVLVFLVYLGFGDRVLGLFGESYAEGQLVLILLSVGLLADAATGPTRIVMMMTGRERDYVRIFGGLMFAGLLVQIAVIPLFGVVAAAAVNAGTRVVAQIAIAVWTRRHTGIDTSILGIVWPAGQRGDVAPAAGAPPHS